MKSSVYSFVGSLYTVLGLALAALYWAFPEIRTDVEEELPELQRTQRDYNKLDDRLELSQDKRRRVY